MNSLFQDLRFSLRLLRRTPGFALAAIAVLALGIGANTAMFSLVHELLWSPRPYQNPEEIVQLYTQSTKNPGSFRLASYPAYRELVSQESVFDGILAHNLAMVGIGEGDTSRRTFAGLVSSNYFSVLGVPLAQGRAFLPEEETPGSNPAVVIASHLFWKKSGYDPALVGQTIRVNERLFTIVGITPAHFTGTMMVVGPELYFPLGDYDVLSNQFDATTAYSLERANAYNLFLVGRLKSGVTRSAADAALRTQARNLERAYPVEQKDQTMIVGPLPRMSSNTNPTNESHLTVLGTLLLSMSAVVLLIACLNLANMLLARGAARRKEIAVRLALGGGRIRLIRQLLTEGLVLALAGGAAGLVLAIWTAGALVQSLGALVPLAIFFRGAANPAIFAATFGFCTFATVAFALGPALKITRGEMINDLKEQAGEDAAWNRRRRWLPRHPLVVAQIALSLALLCAAGLFVRGAMNAASIDTGFRAEQTILVELDPSLGGYDREQSLLLYRSLTERLATVPGVQQAAVGSVVPFGMITITRDVRRAGITVAPEAHPTSIAEGKAFSARWTSTGSDYFSAMGLPLLRGRTFTTAEAGQEGAPLVAVIDERLARQLFPDGDALGQHIQFATRDTDGEAAHSMEIVGIVPVTRWALFDERESGAIYVPFAQGYMSNAFLHLRTSPRASANDPTLFDTIRREVRTIAPNVPLFSVKTFQHHLDASVELWMVRAGATTFGLFGALALLLAVVGIYGVKAYAVSRRTREIGIRMALGAAPALVQRMILREGLAMTLVGLGLGIALGVVAGQACASLLYRVSAFDPLTFLLATVVLAAAAMLACWLPARRATKISPMTALRTE